MSAAFESAIERVLSHEGAYARHPDDPGGETMWGITARVAITHGYTGPMIAMTRDQAKAIYLELYWKPIRGDDLPERLAWHVLDAAVHSGPVQAAKWLQRALGVDVDGVIGPRTIAAARDVDAAGAAPRIVARITGQRLKLMADLPTWPAFGRGWARRLAANLQDA